MDIRKIKKLIELLEESSLTEIEIVEGEESVRLSRGGMAATPAMHHALAPMYRQLPGLLPPRLQAPPRRLAQQLRPAVDEEPAVPEGELVRAPDGRDVLCGLQP